MPVAQFALPYRPAWDSNGKIIPGALLYFTLEGTSTPTPVYADAEMTETLANPVEANGVGRFPPIYYDSAIPLRARLYEADAEVGVDTPLEEYDPFGLPEGSLESIDFVPTWSGAVTTSVAKKLADLPHLYDLIGEDDRTTAFDATAALNAALATGEQFVLPSAEVRFGGTLNVMQNGAGFRGQGYNSRLVHTSATADMFLLGNGTDEISGLRFSDFWTWSTVNKTAGAVFNGRFVSDSYFENVFNSSLDDYKAAGNVNRMWNGYIFNRFDAVRIFGGQTVAKNCLIQMQGNLDNSFGVELSIDGNWRGLYATVGIRQGGGTGGVYYGRGDLSSCGTGVSIDQTLTNTYNREAFFSSLFTIDSSTGAGVVIDQTIEAPAQFIFDRTWTSSNGTHGLWIKNAKGARVIASLHAYNNNGDGVRLDDATTYLNVPSDSRFDLNDGFAINPTVASTRLDIGEPSFLVNAAGNFNTAVNPFVTQRVSTAQFNVSPSLAWANDYTTATMTVGNNANAVVPPGSGLIVVASNGNGHVAQYLVGGGVAKLVSTTGISWVESNAPAPGQASIGWDGSAYRLYNNLGASQIFSVALAAKTRTTA